MPVVSNTSPILNLAITGQHNLLHLQFNTILVPQEVIAELRLDEPRLGSAAIQQAVNEGWIQPRPLNAASTPIFTLLRQILDVGESAAIALALETQAELLLLDEREGRKTAKSLGLNVTGVLGILLKARATGAVEMSLLGIRVLERM